MGQKSNPIGLRVAVNKDWRSKWYADKKEFPRLLEEDRKIRGLLKKKLESASVPKILIERAANRCRITNDTSIGKSPSPSGDVNFNKLIANPFRSNYILNLTSVVHNGNMHISHQYGQVAVKP